MKCHAATLLLTTRPRQRNTAEPHIPTKTSYIGMILFLIPTTRHWLLRILTTSTYHLILNIIVFPHLI